MERNNNTIFGGNKMKIFVTYSNTPNCIECGNKVNENFLKQDNKFIPILGGKELYKGNN